jgi:hypothetical protein
MDRQEVENCRSVIADHLTCALDILATATATASPTGSVRSVHLAELSEVIRAELLDHLARLAPCAHSQVIEARHVLECAPSNTNTVDRITEQLSTALGTVLSPSAHDCTACEQSIKSVADE